MILIFFLLPPPPTSHTFHFIQPHTHSPTLSSSHIHLTSNHTHIYSLPFILESVLPCFYIYVWSHSPHPSSCEHLTILCPVLFVFNLPTFSSSFVCLHHPSPPPSPSSRHLSGHQKAAEPRTPRCGWDVRVRSPRDPAEVVLALREAAQGCGCQVHLAGPFLLSCTHGAAGARVAFEAEVCQLPSGLGQSSGVRFKRLWGAPLAFRDIATKVSKELELWGRQEAGQVDDRQDKLMNEEGGGGRGTMRPPLLPPWAPPHLMRLAMPRLRQRPSSSDATNHSQTNGCTDTDRPPSADLWWPLTLELSVTYNPCLNTPPPPYYVSPWSQPVFFVFFSWYVWTWWGWCCWEWWRMVICCCLLCYSYCIIFVIIPF